MYINTTQIVETYTEDINITAYRLNQQTEVLRIANDNKGLFTSSEITDLEEKFETFGRAIVNATSNYTNSLVQSVFYHNAIIKTMKRSIVNSTACGCSPTLEYIVGKSGYFCQEDYKLNRQAILLAFDSLPSHSHDDSLVRNFAFGSPQAEIPEIDIINVISSSEAFLENIKNSFQNPSPSNSLNCFWGTGSSLGCCGNYAGCCYYRHFACLMHDIACLDCDHWYCGPQCQSGGN